MSDAIRIREADERDRDFILSLTPRFVSFELPKGRSKPQVQAAIHADIEHAWQESAPGDHFFVAEDRAARPTGFLHVQVQRDFFSGARACHVSDLAVAPGYDGRGIGAVLLAHAEAWAVAHRCWLLTLSVFPANSRAQALYTRAGFVPDLLRMSKSLKK